MTNHPHAGCKFDRATPAVLEPWPGPVSEHRRQSGTQLAPAQGLAVERLTDRRRQPVDLIGTQPFAREPPVVAIGEPAPQRQRQRHVVDGDKVQGCALCPELDQVAVLLEQAAHTALGDVARACPQLQDRSRLNLRLGSQQAPGRRNTALCRPKQVLALQTERRRLCGR